MHELHELKETLCRELKNYGEKQNLNASELDYVDKLAHTVKNLDKIIDNYEENEKMSYRGGESYASYRMPMGMSYEDNMASNARGRGRYAKRDSMGRYSLERGYSRDDEMIAELRELMSEAPDERTRQEFKKFIEKIEPMM